MFEEFRIRGTPITSIALETRARRRIDNSVSASASAEAIQPAGGGYNCAGHIWASRRTAIYERKEWDKILSDDGYRQLRDREPILPGDIVIYRDPDPGIGIIHFAEVMRVENQRMNVVFALSKWCDWAGEYLHHVADIQFRQNFPDVHIEYWTERFRT
jgi:hypothetical protein